MTNNFKNWYFKKDLIFLHIHLYILKGIYLFFYYIIIAYQFNYNKTRIIILLLNIFVVYKRLFFITMFFSL